MTSAQHTPGPWKIQISTDMGTRRIVRVTSADGKIMYEAEAFLHERDEQNDPKELAKWEQKIANARLIAAAPELLEALKLNLKSIQARLPHPYKTVREWAEAVRDNSSNSQAKMDSEAALAMLDAIAKAEGK